MSVSILSNWKDNSRIMLMINHAYKTQTPAFTQSEQIASRCGCLGCDGNKFDEMFQRKDVINCCIKRDPVQDKTDIAVIYIITMANCDLCLPSLLAWFEIDTGQSEIILFEIETCVRVFECVRVCVRACVRVCACARMCVC